MLREKGHLPNYFTVVMFFEGIGVLLYRELIDIDLTEYIFSGPIKKTWGKMKPIVEDDRKKLDDTAAASGLSASTMK